jgi:hypothetical protein
MMMLLQCLMKQQQLKKIKHNHKIKIKKIKVLKKKIKYRLLKNHKQN